MFEGIAAARSCMRAIPRLQPPQQCVAGPSRLTSIRHASTALRAPASRPRVARSPLGSYFTPSFRDHPGRTYFTPSRRLLSTVSPTIESAFAQAAAPASHAAEKPVTIPRSLPIWLFSCAGLVFGIVVIGGLTRLTESGLSITEWEPITGILPPMTEAQWAVEWDKYKVSPEGVLTNSKIDMSEFKFLFYMEWGHRVAGRLLGAAFIVPTVYYMTRYRLPKTLPPKLLLLGLGIGFQGALGWYMVKSGLEQEIIDNKAVPRVSQYRLAAHLSAALALYLGMIGTAIGVRRDMKLAQGTPAAEQSLAGLRTLLANPAVKKYKHLIHLAAAMVYLTAVSGAFVAGLDAGLVYNEFPTMGGRLVPDSEELMDKRYAKKADGSDKWWRNMLENPVTAQFDHRVFAMTTFSVLVSLPLVARRRSLAMLPKQTRNWALATAGAAVMQVTLGISTLLYLVPVPLAAAHQAGSVVVLTCIMGLMGSLRKPGRALEALKRGFAQRVAATRPVVTSTYGKSA